VGRSWSAWDSEKGSIAFGRSCCFLRWRCFAFQTNCRRSRWRSPNTGAPSKTGRWCRLESLAIYALFGRGAVAVIKLLAVRVGSDDAPSDSCAQHLTLAFVNVMPQVGLFVFLANR